MPSAWGHTRLLETDWRLITQESHCFSCGSVKGGITREEERNLYLWETVLLGARLREGVSDEECGIFLEEIRHRLTDI